MNKLKRLTATIETVEVVRGREEHVDAIKGGGSSKHHDMGKGGDSLL